MRVEGEGASHYDAVRLDSFVPANRGTLLEADDQTGFVRWQDTPDSTKTVTLGQHAIRIMKKAR